MSQLIKAIFSIPSEMNKCVIGPLVLPLSESHYHCVTNLPVNESHYPVQTIVIGLEIPLGMHFDHVLCVGVSYSNMSNERTDTSN